MFKINNNADISPRPRVEQAADELHNAKNALVSNDSSPRVRSSIEPWSTPKPPKMLFDVLRNNFSSCAMHTATSSFTTV